MHCTIELLVNGDGNVLQYYGRAVERWKEIWSRPEAAAEIIPLATMLSDEEPWFVDNCGGPEVGPEIMVVSGIGMLYSTQTGFQDNLDRVRRLFDAFQQSFCSINVKGIAQDVADYYHLFEARVA